MKNNVAEPKIDYFVTRTPSLGVLPGYKIINQGEALADRLNGSGESAVIPSCLGCNVPATLAVIVTWPGASAVTKPMEETIAPQLLEQRQTASEVTSLAVPLV
jgi:hypothetical protein